MRLADFILNTIEPILQQWEDFARTMTPASLGMDAETLRDHAGQMLLAIAADLQTPQSVEAQISKSHGEAPASKQVTPAETHADIRHASGFTIAQVIAEYRALRTSVLMLWMPSKGISREHEIADVIRFNEAIDQGIAESVVSYTQAVDAARNVFLGILGHDLRSPLGAILLSAEVLLSTGDLAPKQSRNVSRIYSSVKRSAKIVGDLLDFTRTQLGSGIPIRKLPEDLVMVCEAMVEEARAYHPDHTIDLHTQSSLPAQVDRARMEQVVANLIGNAIEHGAAGAPVTVTLKADNEMAVITVHNEGPPIGAEARGSLFNPMVRHLQNSEAVYGPGAGLGLGLYIASAIVSAHQGRIEVESEEGTGTTFTVCIPC